jgi:hypothetical protein
MTPGDRVAQLYPGHWVARVTLDHIDITMALYTIVAFDVIVFVIPLVALLRSSAMMWSKEHLWNFSVLQEV